MSNDIVARLRRENDGLLTTGLDISDVLLPAAAEIERLRARVSELEARHLAGGISGVAGCACPPGANIACTNVMCPRKTPKWTT